MHKINLTLNFLTELGSLPKTERKKVEARIKSLSQSPTSGSNLKKLKGYKALWRMRLGAYRLIYRVDSSPDAVTLLMVGPRKSIYDRLDLADDGGPSVTIVSDHPELLQPEPSPEEIGRAAMALALAPKEEPAPDNLLPVRLTAEVLAEWNIPEPYHQLLKDVETEAQLLEVQGIPAEWHDRVIQLVYPPQLHEVLEQPIRRADPVEQLEEGATGVLPLSSFLLRLDPDQQALLDVFDAGRGEGPWLVRGGPGSGKTVVALYAIRDILARAEEEGTKPRILFSTYTRALATAAGQLLRHLGIEPEDGAVDVVNVDRLARDLSPQGGPALGAGNDKLTICLEGALRSCILNDRAFPFSMKDEGFLLDEIDWVILGRGITERAEYLKVRRPGRSRKLDEAARRHLWNLHIALREQLQTIGRRLFADVVVNAVQAATPRYDHVFVDEVHDLKPLAVRLCVDLCKVPSRVLLTLDPNQSIYGARQEWAEALPRRSLAGQRGALLRRNHRSTVQIWEASNQILSGLELPDPETLADQGELTGPIPILTGVDSEQEAKTITRFLHEGLIEERAGPGCAAVLCPTNWDCHSVAKALPARLRARAMDTHDLDLDHPGVKVLTMHAAKGLQFPLVVIARMERGRMPWKAPAGIDARDHEQLMRRLFFVACSRAMRRLMVVHRKEKPSPLLDSLDEEAWDLR
ncbi:MAG: hypothetical protein DRI90_00750 [Deltaproteobacteria bacterium]|nr:MAG: hypothetical protein DRI90_00750 [Deltaproteobacteria bacterium]